MHVLSDMKAGICLYLDLKMYLFYCVPKLVRNLKGIYL